MAVAVQKKMAVEEILGSGIGSVVADVQSPDLNDAEKYIGSGKIVGSGNELLERLFVNNPEYVNREALLPCTLGKRPVFLDEDFAGSGLEPMIREQIGTIITPRGIARLTDAKRANLRVLASPYECGRVLELEDLQFERDGLPCVITIKGVGCTSFSRQTGAENPWMLGIHRSFKPEYRRKLGEFPFLTTDRTEFGVLHKPFALEELEGVRQFQEHGADTERILAIYRLLKIPDQKGVLRPISYYQERGIIHKEAQPVIMVRALKSNFRLLDLVMLDELGKTASIEPLIEHCKEQYGVAQKVNNPTLNEYVMWLTQKVLNQELRLMLNGFEMSSGRWQDLGRNISILGEEIDLEEVKVSRYAVRNPRDYADHVKRHFDALEGTFRSFTSILSHYSREEIDATAYGDLFFDEAISALREVNLKKVYAGFEEKGRWDLEDFKKMVVRELFSHYTSYFLFGRDQDFVEQYQAHVKGRVEPLLGYTT